MNELMSNTIDELAQALNKAQAIIENVSRDKKGVHSTKYADLANCLDAVKKPLSDNGLSISQIVTVDNDKQVLVTLLMHSSGQWLKSTLNIENKLIANSTWHQMGSAITYARRYALSAIIGLAQEDDDGQSLIKKQEQAQVQEKIKDNAEVINELIAICEKNNIDPKEFAAFHNINRKNLDGAKNGIDNFTKLKEEFENAQHASSH